MALARALMKGADDAGDAAAWENLGIRPELRASFTGPKKEIPLWPENQTPLAVFAALQTQWRVGMGGPTGLDYTAIPPVLELYEIPPSDRRRLFDDLRVMEAEALKVFADGRAKN